MAGSLAGQTIQTGDRLAFDIRQTSTGTPFASYFGIIFQGDSPGPDRYYTSTGLAADQNGNLASLYSVNDNQWHHSVTDLSGYAGQVMGAIRAGEQGAPWTGYGTWDIWIANAVVLRSDGSMLPLFTGQTASVPGIASTCGGNGQTFQTESTPVTDPAVNTNYYLADHLGTTQMELSAGGWPVWQGQFAPFGQELDNQNTSNRFKFTGKERDTESGLDYFGARYYASSMGRWMSPDWSAKQEPLPYSKLDNPQTLNLYNYVQNNPLSSVDDDGHETIRVAWKSTGAGSNHSFIIVTAPNGSVTIFRAGPNPNGYHPFSGDIEEYLTVAVQTAGKLRDLDLQDQLPPTHQVPVVVFPIRRLAPVQWAIFTARSRHRLQVVITSRNGPE